MSTHAESPLDEDVVAFWNRIMPDNLDKAWLIARAETAQRRAAGIPRVVRYEDPRAIALAKAVKAHDTDRADSIANQIIHNPKMVTT